MLGFVWSLVRRLHDACLRMFLPAAPVALDLVHKEGETRAEIYRARHSIYSRELGQYPISPEGALSDYTDAYNVYVTATGGRALQGFVAVTPPGDRKAFQKHGITAVHDDSYEIRLLSVLPGYRGRGLSEALMYAAMRYVEACGGQHIEAMARQEVLPLYLRVGMRPVPGAAVQVGSVQYVHVHAHVSDILHRPPTRVEWRLPFPVATTAPCAHGGKGLEALDPEGINADVLDAWFPPAPSVVREFVEHASDIHVTPPAQPAELARILSSAKKLPQQCFVFGAGSSDLIYRCLFAWLTPASRVLVLSPTYAEYAHVLRAIGCSVTEWRVDGAYRMCPDTAPAGQWDLVVACNPNSPTGILHENVQGLLAHWGPNTRVWVDETYMEYAGTEHSVEPHVMTNPNLVVCKSLSKAYALSGVRVGYVCAHPAQLDGIRARTPPWIVSRVALRAATEALRSTFYYARRYEQTHALRKHLVQWLQAHAWQVVHGSCANFVMCKPPPGHTAADIVERCAARKLYIRLVDDRHVRIAVKDPDTAEVMCSVLDAVVRGSDVPS